MDRTKSIKSIRLFQVVELRNGELNMFVQTENGKFLINEEGSDISFDNYNSEFKYRNREYDELDIMKVYSLAKQSLFANQISTLSRAITWERIVEMTMEEISKALGKEIKIVKRH